MCDYSMHLLKGVSHWGKSAQIADCPNGGKHETEMVPVIGYIEYRCKKCGLTGSCTE